jgi:hypothetical protein
MAGRLRIYALLGTAVLVVWAGARQSTPLAAVAEASRSTTSGVKPSRATPPDLPMQLDRPMLEQASRDPFAALLPPAPVQLVKKPPVVAPSVPTPPPLNLRFTGKMTAPDGSQLIFVTYGDTPMSLSLGQTLPNGYKVLAINERAVELNYQPLNFTARLDLPDPPRYEIR